MDIVSAASKGIVTYCKFLSANDTGKTGGHQAGILISNSALSMTFPNRNPRQEHIAKRTVQITWNDDIETTSDFTWYTSKGEQRITRFGRGFELLGPEYTGALFVLIMMSEDVYNAYILNTEEEINDFLNLFGISSTETNRIVEMHPEAKEDAEVQEFIKGLVTFFPTSEQMSLAARTINDRVYNHSELIQTDPDRKIIDWTNMEYTLFRAVEQKRYGWQIKNGFSDVDEFVKLANEVLNRRKSRAGKSLEHHLAAIFDGNRLNYTAQAVTEGNKRPDFIFPSQEAYHNSGYPVEKIISLAAKTTCKDRWRQVINEADRLRGRPKYLCTLQQGISEMQMNEMQAENVILVVPRIYIKQYPQSCRDRILSLSKFVSFVKEVENV